MPERFRPTTGTIGNGIRPPHRKPDPTNNARQKRFQARRKAEAEAVAAALAAAVSVNNAAVVTPRRREPVNVVAFGAAIGLASISAFFGIIGLTKVFSGAFWPVIAMGITLETAKLAGITWLGRNRIGPLWIVITALAALLMGLSAVGSFGYLSSAHIGHVASHRSVVDLRAADVEARTKIQAAVLADINGRVSQIDSGITETIRRGRTISAMTLADAQKRNRADLVLERDREAGKLAAIEIEAARIAADRAGLAADTGPIRYLAALVGIDADALMRAFIALIAIILDPLACVLLLAATYRRGAS
jgi:hypothetical protein